MSSFNKVVLMGNLVADPELKYTPGGLPVCDFSIAMNRSHTRKESGEKIDEVTFVSVTAWRRIAEIAVECLKKGRPVLIEGWLSQDRWEDKESGQKRSKLFVTAERITLVGKKESDEDAPAEETEEVA